MNVEQDHMDILQNIEFAIVSVYKEHPLLVDFDVENALSALISRYFAEATTHELRRANLNERAQLVYERVEAMCEWRLGRESSVAEDNKKFKLEAGSVTLDVILACLKHIRKSVQRWNKEGGRQGYLTFIGRFIR